ncbi:MAG: hypothetical protein P1V20_30690 [Verrucomicrobiales bacterium]|nr:hypothetical protein [Verrucomicrobiales bacterium]
MTASTNTLSTPVSARVARQRVTGEIAFHSGQSFVTDNPKLVNRFREVPVWAVQPDAGRVKEIGFAPVCRERGEEHHSEKKPKDLCNAGLEAISEVSNLIEIGGKRKPYPANRFVQ